MQAVYAKQAEGLRIYSAWHGNSALVEGQGTALLICSCTSTPPTCPAGCVSGGGREIDPHDLAWGPHPCVGRDIALAAHHAPPPALQVVYAKVADGKILLNNKSVDLWVGRGVPLVDWFAGFAERLQSGYYQADKLTPHSSVATRPDALAFRGISLYPRGPPDYVSCELPACLAGAAACCGGKAGSESCLYVGKSIPAAGAWPHPP